LAAVELDLRRLEFDLLACLATRAGSVVTRQELFKRVWRRHPRDDQQTIDVHICWLRRKLGESARQPRYLRTVRGIGFTMPETP
jgi:DNA-binding response OmpR family regulator